MGSQNGACPSSDVCCDDYCARDAIIQAIGPDPDYDYDSETLATGYLFKSL